MTVLGYLSELRLFCCNHLISWIPSHFLRLWFYRRIMGFRIGNKTTIFLNCRFDCAQGLTIGSPSVVNRGCRLDNRGGLHIGDNVTISEEVCILTADHDPKTPD